MQIIWKIQAWFYKQIRFLFVPDWDKNEDYECMVCGKPFLRRYLWCSEKCQDGDLND